MSLGVEHHRAVAGELAEWLEDVTDGGIGSRVVLVGVPAGWGRSAVLHQFAAVASADEGPVVLVVQISGDLPPGRAVQAPALRKDLEAAAREPWVVRRLGLDTVAGRAQLGVGLGGLVASGPVAAAALLAASLAVTVAGNAWDDNPAGEAGGVARAARFLARVSVSVPMVVIIDDADCLDPELALALIRGLAGRADGQVLVVAAAAPDSDLARALTREPGYDLAGRVVRAEADPSMAHADRIELAAGLLPLLPAAGIERIARQTATFKDVFTIAAAGRLAELGPDTEPVEAVAVVDAVTSGVLERTRPSPEAVVAAWAGGALHDRQARAALEILGEIQQENDPRVVRADRLVRLAGPVDGRTAGLVAALPVAARQQLAAVVLSEAAALAADASATLVDRVVARQAAHHVRGYLTDRNGLPTVQAGLIRGLERLGDRAAAYDVATEALAGLEALPPAARDAGQRQELLTAALRLAQTRPGRGQDEDLVAAEAVKLALAGGAVVRPEARVWAAVDLLHRPGRRHEGLRLARQVTDELEARHIHGELANQWRLLLAFHVGQAGDGALAERLLASLINSGPSGQQDAAAAVLRVAGGPHSDTRLQIILLEDELTRTPVAADDDLLRLHHALAADYLLLGNYRAALRHSRQELPLRRQIQGDDHLATLATRGNIAGLTSESGDPAEALRLSQELLPDWVRVFGPDHPGTLATRGNIAQWTGESGDSATALRLSQELLPDRVRVLGKDHPYTLTTRDNIAGWTSRSGDPAEALRLSQELLPDWVRVFGPDHLDTLTTRNNIANLTGESGDPAAALRLFQDLLPDLVRVLGPDHPDTLRTRNNIAQSASESGDPGTALRLAQELLPDLVQVLGPDHPNTLVTRDSIAHWTEVLSENRKDAEGTPEAHNTADPDDHSTL